MKNAPHSDRVSHAVEEPTHSADGVDLTLIRWFLSLTPYERLRALQNNLRAIERIRAKDDRA